MKKNWRINRLVQLQIKGSRENQEHGSSANFTEDHTYILDLTILCFDKSKYQLVTISSVNKMFIIWQKQEQFNSLNLTGLY